MHALKILHLNIGKRKQVQQSLLNDEGLEDFTALATVEPYIYRHPQTNRPTVTPHRRWQLIQPSTIREDCAPRHAFRALIWVNSRHRTTPLEIPSSDTTATVVHFGEKNILVIACYDPNAADRAEGERDLAGCLSHLEDVMAKAQATWNNLETVICSDLNRHHVIWGGPAVDRGVRAQEGEPIVDFMQQQGLRSMLRSGTVTWEHQSGRSCSTPDVVLASHGIADVLTRCSLYAIDHGSDHRAVALEANIHAHPRTARKARRLYDDADWDRIRTDMKEMLQLKGRRDISTTAEFEREATEFTELTSRVLERHVPRAKPSPYAKRWWTRELTQLRHTLTALRNRVVAQHRSGRDVEQAAAQVRAARRLYFDAIDQQKRKHWTEFLDDPANIWKANEYTKGGWAAFQVPALRVDTHTVEADAEKAEVLLSIFFPVPPEPVGDELRCEMPRPRGLPSELPPLAAAEVKRAIFRSNPKKAAGTDEITFRVWRELWPEIEEEVVRLYQASLTLRYVPREWKVAKIIALRKPGKPDYTKPKAFRPISLLPTISKGLEAVVAARLSYLAETYKLLPTNHFGARPRRSAEQALNTLVERIHEAWRRGRACSLVSFDVQGAFNGVHSAVLHRRLLERFIPRPLADWILSFCMDRQGAITLGEYQSEIRPIAFPGIPQGSPLSPILYVFYNATLVEGAINRQGGSIGFVDDFNAWVAGESVEENTRRIQNTVIPKAEQWARESGATFEAEKTGFIHFRTPTDARETSGQPTVSLTFNGTDIPPQDAIKVLGVTLDSRLDMRTHVSKITAKAMGRCTALTAVKGLRPKQMRQLYQACVLPGLDYAASTWFYPGKRGMIGRTRQLDRVQKLGARLILRAFRTASGQVLEAEACLEQTYTRLERKVTTQAVKVLALGADNPAGTATRQAIRSPRHLTPFRCSMRQYSVLQTLSRGPFETDPAWVQPPWQDSSQLILTESRDDAKRACEDWCTTDRRALFTDASVSDAGTGTALVLWEHGRLTALEARQAGAMASKDVLKAELLGIERALIYAVRNGTGRGSVWKRFRIFSDCQKALQAISQGMTTASSRPVLTRVARLLDAARKLCPSIRLCWVPAHSGIAGNELADKCAKEAAATGARGSEHQAMPGRGVQDALQEIERARSKEKPAAPNARAFGKYTWSLDRALPGAHTKGLYDRLTSEEAAVLVQARTGHCHLNKCLFQLKKTDSPQCSCGADEESVRHVILACPLWEAQRRELRIMAGQRWGDLSFLLGGQSSQVYPGTGRRIDRGPDKWKPDHRMVKKTIQFLIATGRLTSTQKTSDHSNTTTPASTSSH